MTTPATAAPLGLERHAGDHARVRVMVVDDQVLFREGLVQLLGCAEDIDVIGDSGGGDPAVAAARQRRPDVIVLGADVPDGGTIDHVRRFLQVVPQPRIIVLAAHDDPRRVRFMLSSGVQAYVLKSTKIDELLSVIRVVDRHRDRVVLSVSRGTAERLKTDEDDPLSARERQILGFVAEGLRNAEIALRLRIAEGTVKRHLTNIYSKLGASSRTDAVRKAARRGLTYD